MDGAEQVRGREGGGEGRKGTGQVMQVPVGCGEDLGFYLQGGGTLEGCGQRRGGA